MKPIHWRRSRFGKYLRHLPRIKHIRGTWIHRRLGEPLFAPELWHPERRSFALGFAVGAFFGLVPAPIQMLGAALGAYYFRANIPAAIAATWISNPFTMPFFVYAQYWVGCLILRHGHNEDNAKALVDFVSNAPSTLFDSGAWASVAGATVPFFVGALPAALVFAVLTYPVILILWDWVTVGIHARQKPVTPPK